MGTAISHWGLLDDSDSAGSYEVAKLKPVRPDIAMVLTEAGEVLIHRSCKPVSCCVAIVLGRAATGLSRPQSERLQRAWDMALAVADGNKDAVQLQPMSHHWRFSRTDYMTVEEWHEQQRLSSHNANVRHNEIGDSA